MHAAGTPTKPDAEIHRFAVVGGVPYLRLVDNINYLSSGDILRRR
jgi:hypothetical protein